MTAIIGPDLASVDKNNTPNYLVAKQAGARFVIIRAVYGRGGSGGGPWLDPTWARDSDRLLTVNVKRGAYLFLCFPQTDPGVNTPTPEAQVDAFAGYVQLTSYHDFVPIIDIEEKSSLNAEDYHAWVLRAVHRMKDHYGCWPMIYLSNRVWAEYMPGQPSGDLQNCPPWIAKPWTLDVREPIDLTGNPSVQPSVPSQLGTNNWWLFQYQGDALGWPGFNATVDASRFNLTTVGANGSHVKWLQQRLGVTVDGSFGIETHQAVVQLQIKYAITADGIVGPDTFAVLAWHI
jgi:peptidoglycan hydrolase-like protein with peptidoglycan-binding domain